MLEHQVTNNTDQETTGIDEFCDYFNIQVADPGDPINGKVVKIDGSLLTVWLFHLIERKLRFVCF